MRNQDYIFCTNMTLQVLKEQRRKMLADSLAIDPTIRNGLHKSGKYEYSIRTLYFEQYCVQWLDEHWNKMNDILSKEGYSTEFKRLMINVFAQHFSCLYNQYFTNFPLHINEAIPEILKVKLECLQLIIDFDNSWEEKSESLRADTSKRKEQFKKVIEGLTSANNRR